MSPRANIFAVTGHKLASVVSEVVPWALLFENFNRPDDFHTTNAAHFIMKGGKPTVFVAIILSMRFQKREAQIKVSSSCKKSLGRKA
ncbi:MAG TPA: hypothetical protein VFZ40_10665 [Pyrinomonadaceae bacterium]